MQKYNKHLSRLLITFLLGALLSACVSQAPATPTPPALVKELVFYDWEDDMPQSGLDAFTQEYGVKVNYVVYEAQQEAVEKIRAGQKYDVVVMESRFIPNLAQAGLIATINYQNVPNFMNIAANFRDLSYDPENRYSIPFNWGTTGLVVRSDLVKEPVTRWADLWDPRYAGRTAIWTVEPRAVIALALKSLGYSANSEKWSELETALKRLLELKRHVLILEKFDIVSSAAVMSSGKAAIAMGYAKDVLLGRQQNKAIIYVLPKEGTILWGDNFVIAATDDAHKKYTAELFLNFLLRPEISAQIANQNLYATPNEAAFPFIKPEILNDPVIFPPEADMKNAEIILPLSPQGQTLYEEIWARFLAGAVQPE